MTDDQQAAARLAELQELRRTDPVALITLYRRVAGLGVVELLPPNLTLPDMIRAIVENEMRRS